MRRLPFLILFAAAACQGRKDPPVGSKELLDKLSADLRAQNARDYPGCTFGSSVAFDGHDTYRARVFTRQKGKEPVALVYRRNGDRWECVDAESKPGCAQVAEACKK